jgi:hypothetical protein
VDDNLTGDAKNIFDAFIQSAKLSMAARGFDNVDHSNGDNVPNAAQLAQAAGILATARELRRILRGV